MRETKFFGRFPFLYINYQMNNEEQESNAYPESMQQIKNKTYIYSPKRFSKLIMLYTIE